MPFARCAVLIATVAGMALSQPAVGQPFDFSPCDAAVARAVEEKKCPGAVLLVGRGDQVLYLKAYANRAVEPTPVAMTTDTIFDLASLSKSIGCATSVLVLADRGKIDLDATVATYLPEFGNHGKETITVKDLLAHVGGLVPDNPMADYAGTPVESMAKVMAIDLKWPPRTHFAYTDVGFIVLGELVHRVSGKPLDQFAHDEVFEPLGMHDTTYNPPEAWRERIAPTEKRNGRWIVGEVHDPRAYALGGVAGHAGLFSTASDVSKWVRMLNAGGELDGKRILSEAMVKRMLKPVELPEGKGTRGLGVDMASSYAGIRGTRFPSGSFGHTGWTGTSYWCDPVSKVYVILLTNRVHPDGTGDVQKLRREVNTLAAEAVLGPAPTTQK
ncbi:MAG: serine hydrolase domain-containing protein [Tepidisphaeraceae bacterium]